MSSDYVRLSTENGNGLLPATRLEVRLDEIQQAQERILAELKPITELFQSLAQNPMLKQFLA